MEVVMVGMKLVIDGYVYIGSRLGNQEGRKYWDCDYLRRQGCKGCAVTQLGWDGKLTVIKGPEESPHNNHSPDYDDVDATVMVASIKRKAADDQDCVPAKVSTY